MAKIFDFTKKFTTFKYMIIIDLCKFLANYFQGCSIVHNTVAGGLVKPRREKSRDTIVFKNKKHIVCKFCDSCECFLF